MNKLMEAEEAFFEYVERWKNTRKQASTFLREWPVASAVDSKLQAKSQGTNE